MVGMCRYLKILVGFRLDIVFGFICRALNFVQVVQGSNIKSESKYDMKLKTIFYVNYTRQPMQTKLKVQGAFKKSYTTNVMTTY